LSTIDKNTMPSTPSVEDSGHFGLWGPLKRGSLWRAISTRCVMLPSISG
jgi:hypothetical protein